MTECGLWGGEAVLLLSYLPALSLLGTLLIVILPTVILLTVILLTVMTVLEQEKTVTAMSDRYITPEYLAHLPTSVSLNIKL